MYNYNELKALDEALDYLNEGKISDFIKKKIKKNKANPEDIKGFKITEEQFEKLEPEIKKIYNSAVKAAKEVIKEGDYSKYIEIWPYDKYDIQESLTDGYGFNEVTIYNAEYYKYHELYKNDRGYSGKGDATEDLNRDFLKFGDLVKAKLELPDGVKFHRFQEGGDWDDYDAGLEFTKKFLNRED